MMKWSNNLQFPHTSPLLYSDASESEVWRTPCWQVYQSRATTALGGFNLHGIPCTCTSRRQAYNLTASHFHQSQTYVLTYHVFLYGVKKGNLTLTCHFSLSSRTRGGVVGLEIQINCYISGTEGRYPRLPVWPTWACRHCTHLAKSCCTSGGGEGEKWLPATTVKQIPPPPFQIWHCIQADPAHNAHKCEHPDGLSVWPTNQQRWAGWSPRTCINL